MHSVGEVDREEVTLMVGFQVSRKEEVTTLFWQDVQNTLNKIQLV